MSSHSITEKKVRKYTDLQSLSMYTISEQSDFSKLLPDYKLTIDIHINPHFYRAYRTYETLLTRGIRLLSACDISGTKPFVTIPYKHKFIK